MGQTLYALAGLLVLMSFSMTFSNYQMTRTKANIYQEVSTVTTSATSTVLESIKGKQFGPDTPVYPIPTSTKDCALFGGPDLSCSDLDDYNGLDVFFHMPIQDGNFTVNMNVTVEYVTDDLQPASGVTDTKRITVTAQDSTNFLPSTIQLSRIVRTVN